MESALQKVALSRQHWAGGTQSKVDQQLAQRPGQRVAISGTKSWLEARKYLSSPEVNIGALFNISINDVAGGAECTLRKSADDTSGRRG